MLQHRSVVTSTFQLWPPATGQTPAPKSSYHGRCPHPSPPPPPPPPALLWAQMLPGGLRQWGLLLAFWRTYFLSVMLPPRTPSPVCWAFTCVIVPSINVWTVLWLWVLCHVCLRPSVDEHCDWVHAGSVHYTRPHMGALFFLLNFLSTLSPLHCPWIAFITFVR
jgi:hypothetical protein